MGAYLKENCQDRFMQNTSPIPALSFTRQTDSQNCEPVHSPHEEELPFWTLAYITIIYVLQGTQYSLGIVSELLISSLKHIGGFFQ